MILSRFNFCIDIEKLREFVINNVLIHPITLQVKGWGGWSVYSSNGSLEDGWSNWHAALESGDRDEVLQKLKKMDFKGTDVYDKPTQIFTGYLKEVIETIESYNLNPKRVRIANLKSGSIGVWHQDSFSDLPAYRIHIPIFTNSSCFFEQENISSHMPADGTAYVICVHKKHRIVNYGKTDRIHLIMNVDLPENFIDDPFEINKA